MTTELKDCPFCGGEASRGNEHDEMRELLYIECPKCFCRSGRVAYVRLEQHDRAFEMAAAAWNRRTPEPSSSAPVGVEGECEGERGESR